MPWWGVLESKQFFDNPSSIWLDSGFRNINVVDSRDDSRVNSGSETFETIESNQRHGAAPGINTHRFRPDQRRRIRVKDGRDGRDGQDGRGDRRDGRDGFLLKGFFSLGVRCVSLGFLLVFFF